MKVVLVIVAVIAAVAADDMRQKLLRVLASLEKRGDNQDPPTVVAPITSNPGGNQPVDGISLAEFRDAVDTWGEKSKEFTDSVKSLKPMILNTLTRTQDWESVDLKFEEILLHGTSVYHTILLDVLQMGQRLFDSKETPGFRASSRCTSVTDLSKSFDPANDGLAEVKVIDAMVSDLDCFTGEFKDITRSFDTICMEDDQISVDKALDMLGDVMKYLYRFKLDAENFGVSAKHLGETIAQKYESMSEK